MDNAPIPFPKDPEAVLAQYGEVWMRTPGVKGVALLRRAGVIKFVVMTNDPHVGALVPDTIGGFPTSVEDVKQPARAAVRRS